MMVDWKGDDIRASAFRYKDGNYTVVIETSEQYKGGPLTLNFSGNIGKTFNKFVYNHDNWQLKRNANMTLPGKAAGFNVGTSLTDHLPAGYGTYVYSTFSPVKQIALKNNANADKTGVANNCVAGGTVQLAADLIDCAGGDTVTWSVVSKKGERGVLGDIGSINASGLYSASPTARPGDQISVKAALASDPSVYSIGIMYIQ